MSLVSFGIYKPRNMNEPDVYEFNCSEITNISYKLAIVQRIDYLCYA